MREPANYLGLSKPTGEAHVMHYTDGMIDEALEQVQRMARDPDLYFTWYDAALWSHSIQQRRREIGGEKGAA